MERVTHKMKRGLNTLLSLALVGWLEVAAGQQTVSGSPTLGSSLSRAATDFWKIPDFLEVVIYLMGTLLLVTGLVKFKRYSDTGGREQRIGGALVTGGVGVGLIGITAIYGLISGTFGFDGTSGTIAPPRLN